MENKKCRGANIFLEPDQQALVSLLAGNGKPGWATAAAISQAQRCLADVDTANIRFADQVHDTAAMTLELLFPDSEGIALSQAMSADRLKDFQATMLTFVPAGSETAEDFIGYAFSSRMAADTINLAAVYLNDSPWVERLLGQGRNPVAAFYRNRIKGALHLNVRNNGSQGETIASIWQALLKHQIVYEAYELELGMRSPRRKPDYFGSDTFSFEEMKLNFATRELIMARAHLAPAGSDKLAISQQHLHESRKHLARAYLLGK